MPRYHPPFLDKKITIRNPEDRPADEERDRRGNIVNPVAWGQTVSANKRDQAPFSEAPEGVEIKAGRSVFTIRKRAVAPNAEVIYEGTSYELIGAPVERGGIMGEIWDEYLELHCERRSAQVVA